MSLAPKLVKGGIVLVDPRSLATQRTITLQYNPDRVVRTLQPAATSSDEANTSSALRFTGPPIETITLEAEIDASDALDRNDAEATRFGVGPQLALLESLVYPKVEQIRANRMLAERGAMQIIPMEAPLAIFVWSRSRVIPVRITEFNITEEAFDTQLNPLRARVTLGLRVLSVTDLGHEHRGSDVFLRYQQNREDLSEHVPQAPLSGFGIRAIT